MAKKESYKNHYLQKALDDGLAREEAMAIATAKAELAIRKKTELIQSAKNRLTSVTEEINIATKGGQKAADELIKNADNLTPPAKAGLEEKVTYYKDA
jgi:hypothetical protein